MELFEVLDRQLSIEPSATVYDWIGRDGKPQKSLTAGELRHQALCEAQRLLETTSVDDTIGLATSFGPDFLVGLVACIYAGRTALPLPGPRAGHARKRLLAALAAVEPSVILTTALESNELIEEASRIGAKVSIIGMTSEAALCSSLGQVPKIAVAQFTSGTTSAAKAVLIAGSAILANVRFTANAYGETANDRSFTWLPHYHDMGLFGGLLFPLLKGVRVAQMDSLLFVQSPQRWFQALTDTEVTITGGPAFALSLCLDRISADTLASFDLSRVRAFYCGSDPIPTDMLDLFAQRLAPTGLNPEALFASYGLAEATIYVAGRPGLRLGNSCRVLDDGEHEIRIVCIDGTQWLGGGQEGEIVLSGPSLSAGYLGSMQNRFEKDGRIWLRTGDIGRLRADRLWITGRLKDILIVHGVNVHAVQVECLAGSLDPALDPLGAAAFSVIQEGVEHTVLLIERRRRQTVAQPHFIISQIRARLAHEFGMDKLEISVIAPGALPRTTSGKVSRAQAKLDYLDGAHRGVMT